MAKPATVTDLLTKSFRHTMQDLLLYCCKHNIQTKQESEWKEGAVLTRTNQWIREMKYHFVIVSWWFRSKAQKKNTHLLHNSARRCCMDFVWIRLKRMCDLVATFLQRLCAAVGWGLHSTTQSLTPRDVSNKPKEEENEKIKADGRFSTYTDTATHC